MRTQNRPVKPETTDSYHERIGRVLLHIERHLDEPLGLDHLASVACFSPFHFHRVFRGMTGESVKEHVRRLRLERAATRLRRGDSPVIDLALEAGYETPESFTRAFGSMFGVSPSEYRRGHNGSAPPQPHGKETPPVEVRIEKLPAMRIAYVRHTGPYDQCGTAWEKLMRWAGPRGLLGPGMTMLGISHDDPDVTPPEKLRYDAALVVPEGTAAEGEVGVRDIEAGEYAVVTHMGPYSTLNETYTRLCGEWMPSSGREFADTPAIEFYRNDAQNTPPEQLRTDICMRLA